MARGHDAWFDRTSPVCGYWLAHCDGFTVRSRRGHRLGTVAAAAGTSATGAAAVLVRAPRFGRRRWVGVDRVVGLDPWDETIVVAPRRSRHTSTPRPRVAQTRRVVHLRPRVLVRLRAPAVGAVAALGARGAGQAGAVAARGLRRSSPVLGRWLLASVRLALLVTRHLLLLALRALIALARQLPPAARLLGRAGVAVARSGRARGRSVGSDATAMLRARLRVIDAALAAALAAATDLLTTARRRTQ